MIIVLTLYLILKDSFDQILALNRFIDDKTMGAWKHMIDITSKLVLFCLIPLK